MNETQMDIRPGSLLMPLVRLARFLAKRRLWLLASLIYAFVLRVHAPNIDSSVWRELNVVLGASGLKQLGKRLVWSSTNTPEDIKMEKIKSDVLRGENRRASARFLNFADKQFPAELIGSLIEAFKQISEDVGVERVALEALVAQYGTENRVVLVAGLDFSGSSAVFDFLQEFEDTVAVKTEIPHLSRGRYCLYEVSRHLDDRATLRRYSLEFFCRYILGSSRIGEAMDFRIHKFARRRMLSTSARVYAESVKTCGTLIRAMNSETSLRGRRQIFHALVNQVLNEIVLEKPLKHGEILVLRNAIKAVNLSQAESLGSFTVFACFRDPRDAYVAQTREKFHLGIPVNTWVERASQNYELAEMALRSNEERNSHSNMVRVQFEQFVQSESTRRTVVDFAGLSNSVSSPGKLFEPSRSQKNIGIFRDFGEPSAVSVIEQRMTKFLYG